MRVFTGLIAKKMVAEIIICAESMEEAQKIVNAVADTGELDDMDFEEDSSTRESLSSWDLSDEHQKFYADKEIEEAKSKGLFFDKSALEDV